MTPQAASVAQPTKSGLNEWIRPLLPHIATMLLGGAIGTVGTWYGLKSQVEANSIEIKHIQETYVPASVHAAKDTALISEFDALNQRMNSVDSRLANIEAILMGSARQH